MKRSLLALSLFTMGGLARAATVGPVAISSGTNFYTVDVSSISATTRVRQNIVVGDPSDSTGLAPVDALTGLTVHLATSSVVIPTSSTVSGTINAAQSGTWTVQPGNTANTTAWKVDGSAVTQPVSISGNQTVYIVNPTTSPIQVQASGGALTGVGYQTAGASVPVSLLNATVAVTKSGTWNALGVDVGTGTWPVSIVAGAGSGGTSSNFAAGFPTAGSAAGFINPSAFMQGARVDVSSNLVVYVVNPTSGAQTQSGTWTVQPGNTVNTVGWKVDFSTGIQANQGTAGVGWKIDLSTGVQANQGAAGTSAWKVDFSTGIQARQSILVSSNTAVPTAVADAGEVRPMGDTYGRIVTMPIATRSLVQVATYTLTTNTVETVFISSTSAKFNRLIGCIGENTSATAADITIRMNGGPTLNNVGSFKLGMSVSNVPVGFFPPGGIPAQTANANVTIQGSASVTSLHLTCWYALE